MIQLVGKAEDLARFRAGELEFQRVFVFGIFLVLAGAVFSIVISTQGGLLPGNDFE